MRFTTKIIASLGIILVASGFVIAGVQTVHAEHENSDFKWESSGDSAPQIRQTFGEEAEDHNAGVFRHFTLDEESEKYTFEGSGDQCADWIHNFGNSLDSAEYKKRVFVGGGGCTAHANHDDVEITIEGAESLDAEEKQTASSGTTGADQESEDVCEGPFPFGWFVCGAINSMKHVIDGLTSGLIRPLLEVRPIERFEDGTQQETVLYQVWSNVLTIANVLLVIVFFVFIFSQSLSLNIDAYTVKKALPRLFFAAIGMQLSFYIAGFLVDITNVLGAGVIEIVKMVTDDHIIGLNQGQGLLGSAGVGALLTGLGSMIYTGGILISLILLLLGIIAVVLALIFRQIFILLLIILSPIAFVLWILPNTEKYFKMWWENFTKALLMYPLIMLLLTSGSLLATIADSTSLTGSEGADSILIFVIIAIPLFLVPATFKLAGAGMSATFAGVSKLKSGGDKAMGDSKDPTSFRARHNRRVAARKSQAQVGQRSKVAQIATKPTAAIPGRIGRPGRSSALTGLYRSAANEQQSMENDGIKSDPALNQALVRAGGSQGEMDRYIQSLQSSSDEGDQAQGHYLQSSRSQLHPYVGRDSARLASTRNLIENKKLEHKDMDAIQGFAKTPEVAGSLVNEAKNGMRDSRLDMFGYKYNAESGQVEYDIEEAKRGLQEADAEQIVSQKPRALENLQNVQRSEELSGRISPSQMSELANHGQEYVDEQGNQRFQGYDAIQYALDTAGSPQARESLQGVFSKATESAKGADAKTTSILGKYAKGKPAQDVRVVGYGNSRQSQPAVSPEQPPGQGTPPGERQQPPPQNPPGQGQPPSQQPNQSNNPHDPDTTNTT